MAWVAGHAGVVQAFGNLSSMYLVAAKFVGY